MFAMLLAGIRGFRKVSCLRRQTQRCACIRQVKVCASCVRPPRSTLMEGWPLAACERRLARSAGIIALARGPQKTNAKMCFCKGIRVADRKERTVRRPATRVMMTLVNPAWYCARATPLTKENIFVNSRRYLESAVCRPKSVVKKDYPPR